MIITVQDVTGRESEDVQETAAVDHGVGTGTPAPSETIRAIGTVE